MPVNFRKIQQTYPDALKLTATLKKEEQPVGPVSLSRAIGGGRVLHYAHTKNRETIIVSREAAKKITVIYGPPGCGKTTRARDIAAWYKPEEVCWKTPQELRDFNFKVPGRTMVVIVDDWQACESLSLLRGGFFDTDAGEKIYPHVIACIQFHLRIPPYYNEPDVEHINLKNP